MQGQILLGSQDSALLPLLVECIFAAIGCLLVSIAALTVEITRSWRIFTVPQLYAVSSVCMRDKVGRFAQMNNGREMQCGVVVLLATCCNVRGVAIDLACQVLVAERVEKVGHRPVVGAIIKKNRIISIDFLSCMGFSLFL